MNKVYVCPSLRRDCTWEGDVTEIENHFEDFHLDLLLTDHNNITLSTEHQPMNRILIYNSELYLIQTEIQEETCLLILRIRQPGPRNGVKYHLNVRNLKNTNYLFSSKVAENGYNAVKINDGRIEIDIGAIKLIVGNGDIIGGLDFEQVVRRRESIKLKRKPSFTQSGSVDSISAHMIQLFRTRSEYLDEPEDLPDVKVNGEELFQLQESTNIDNYFKAYMDLVRRFSRNESIVFEEEEIDANITKEENEDELTKRQYDEQEKKEREEYEVKLAMIQCSNCVRYMNPPIFVCLRGHSVCFYCQGDSCQKCGDSITNLSNSDLEDISKSIPHPCRFAKQGCTRTIDYCKVHGHEIRCEHHFYTCPDSVTCPIAPFQYKFGEMLSHIRIMHPSVQLVNESRDVRFIKGSEFFLVCDDVGIFYCRARGIDGNSLEFNVYFCGARDTYFFCHLQIQIKNGKGEDTFDMRRRGNLWHRTLSTKEMKDKKLKEKSIKLHILAH